MHQNNETYIDDSFAVATILYRMNKSTNEPALFKGIAY